MCKWLYSESCTNNIPIIQECCRSLCHRSYPPTTILQCLKALFFFFLEWCTNHLRVLLSILKKWGRCCITKCIWHYCVIAQFVVLHHWRWNCFSFKPPLFLHRPLLHSWWNIWDEVQMYTTFIFCPITLYTCFPVFVCVSLFDDPANTADI